VIIAPLSLGGSLALQTLYSFQTQLFAVSLQVADKVVRCVNGITSDNAGEKARQLHGLIHPMYFSFVAKYVVIHRVAQDADTHFPLQDFIDQVNHQGLRKAVVMELFFNARGLITFDHGKRLVHSGLINAERRCLKLLGSFIGSFVVRRDGFIPRVKLDLRDMLLFSFQTKRLHLTVPFVCRVLMHVWDSRVYTWKQPWLVSLIGLLLTLHQTPLKAHIRLEINMLMKVLGRPIEEDTFDVLFERMDEKSGGMAVVGAGNHGVNSEEKGAEMFRVACTQIRQNVLSGYPLLYGVDEDGDFDISSVQSFIKERKIVIYQPQNNNNYIPPLPSPVMKGPLAYTHHDLEVLARLPNYPNTVTPSMGTPLSMYVPKQPLQNSPSYHP
jgi:hypothetical protein